jgi:cytochrome c oxidase subunit 2
MFWNSKSARRAIAVLGLCLASSVLHARDLGNSGAAAVGNPRVIHIKAMMFKFVPSKISVRKGETVKLRITSTDVLHGFRLTPLSIKVPIQRGQVTDVLLTPNETGKLTANCSEFCGPGHKRMELIINVRP